MPHLNPTAQTQTKSMLLLLFPLVLVQNYNSVIHHFFTIFVIFIIISTTFHHSILSICIEISIPLIIVTNKGIIPIIHLLKIPTRVDMPMNILTITIVNIVGTTLFIIVSVAGPSGVTNNVKTTRKGGRTY